MALGSWFLALAIQAPEQDSLASARDLYASAAYEDALAVLNRLPESSRPAGEVRTIEQYRAFCLLALGRTADAERAIEAVIAREPNFHPIAAEFSPRVRAAFTDVRRRMMPAIIQQQYSQAKAAYDRKEFAAAVAGFNQTLEMMADPDAASSVNQPPLSDLRTLAIGFRDLSATAVAPPPPVVVAPPPAPPPSTEPAPPRIYTGAEPNIVPPMIVRQELPAYPGQVMIGKHGLIEVIIDENGLVESVTMRVPVTAAYDALALAAARTWRYRPATLNGAPVKFRKAIQITVKPTGRP